MPSDSVAHTCDALNLQLRYAYGTENTLEVAPSELRYAGPRADLPAQDCPAAAPNWAAAMQANERTKIFVTVCRGFVNAWGLASQTPDTLPAPPVSLDAAYRLFFEHFQAHDVVTHGAASIVGAALGTHRGRRGRGTSSATSKQQGHTERDHPGRHSY